MRKPQDTPAIRQLHRRIAALQAENRKSQERIDRLQGALIDLHKRYHSDITGLGSRLDATQSVAAKAHENAQSVLTSRIWRTLVGGGGFLLSATQWLHARKPSYARNGVPGVNGPAAGPIPAPAQEQSDSRFLHIHCDEPLPENRSDVSGELLVRGWALAEEGVDQVELLIGTQGAIVARYGSYRPDIAQAYPDIANADRSGFVARLDTSALRDGQHLLQISATSREGRRTEAYVLLGIDHRHGFSSPYARWIAEFEARDIELLSLQLESFKTRPSISILVPVFRTNPLILERTIESVRAQSYPAWELCLVDDHSESKEVDGVLARYAADSRIRVHKRAERGGISAASNNALAMATGEWIVLLDHDDELAQDALFHVVDEINREPEAGIIYSDEDHIDENGRRFDPFFKPQWSPNLILSENYVCHLMAFRRDLALSVNGFRSETDLSQDHDLLLRMSAKTEKISHIPKILYHWRTENESMKRASTHEEGILTSSRRAVQDYVNETRQGARVEPGRVPTRWRVRYPVPSDTRVSILIPSGGKVRHLESVLAGLADRTDYRNFEVVIIDNSRGSEVDRFLKERAPKDITIRTFDQRNQPFNFSVINNRAVESCNSPLLLFLNDDTRPIDPGWLTAMVELAVLPKTGAVGAKLLYPDDTVQHGGIVMGVLGLCGHAFRGVPHEDRYYYDFPDVIRDVSAVTGACLMTPRRVFEEAGGFDEVLFPVAYQDVDLCLKIRANGYDVLYTPHALLYHDEAKTKTARDLEPRAAETQALKMKWRDIVDSDPFYNPNLTRSSEIFVLPTRRIQQAAEMAAGNDYAFSVPEIAR